MNGKITAESLSKQAWDQILTACSDSAHPFASPVLGSLHPPAIPRLRTVILREADRTNATLRCYVDTRSVKINDLRRSPTLSWLFWDPGSRVQVSGSGPGQLLEDEVAEAIFATLPKHGRKAYATVAAPGTPLPHPASGLPHDWPQRELDQTDYARAHFGVLETTLDRLDILHLRREGNVRLAVRWVNQEWRQTWIVP